MASLSGEGMERRQADICIPTHSKLTHCKSPEPLQHLLQEGLEQPGLIPADSWLPGPLAVQDKTSISVVLLSSPCSLG